MNDEQTTAPASPFAAQLELVEAERERKQQVIRRRAEGAQRCAQNDPTTANKMGWRVLDLWAQSGAVNAEAEAAGRLALLGITPPATANQWAAVAELVGVPGEQNPEVIERAALKWAANRTAPTADKPAAVIVQVSDRGFAVDGGEPISVTAMEAAILGAFAKCARPMTTAELERESGYQNPRKVLAGFVKKHAGTPFAAAVRLPGRKGGGGYFVRVVSRG